MYRNNAEIENLVRLIIEADSWKKLDALFPQIVSFLSNENALEFITSCQYHKRPFLSEDDKGRIANYRRLISTCFEQLGNYWDIPPEKCKNIRKLALSINDGEKYSKKEVEELCIERSNMHGQIPDFINVKDVKTLTEIILTSFYIENLLEAHEIVPLVDSPLRDIDLSTLLSGINILKIQLSTYSKKS